MLSVFCKSCERGGAATRQKEEGEVKKEVLYVLDQIVRLLNYFRYSSSYYYCVYYYHHHKIVRLLNYFCYSSLHYYTVVEQLRKLIDSLLIWMLCFVCKARWSRWMPWGCKWGALCRWGALARRKRSRASSPAARTAPRRRPRCRRRRANPRRVRPRRFHLEHPPSMATPMAKLHWWGLQVPPLTSALPLPRNCKEERNRYWIIIKWKNILYQRIIF